MRHWMLFLVVACAITASAQISVPGWPTAGAGGGGGTTCGTPTCTVSTAGSGNGVLALSGNTSGTATFTAPAVAGTSTNGVTMSNVLLAPDGAAATPSYSWSAAPGWGMWRDASGIEFNVISTQIARMNTTAIQSISFEAAGNAGTNSGYQFNSSGGGLGGAVDTGVYAQAPAVVSIGSGSNRDESGLLRWGECRVTADITLPVNTATTVCSWPLPAVAKAWAWQCQIPWAITAGTGTNTIAISVNYTQTPTAATGTETEIKTSNTNTATELWTVLSATGSTTLLTSGTITPNALPFGSSTSGTILASATAGTFSIQMTAAGTTATAAAKAGATCNLY